MLQPVQRDAEVVAEDEQVYLMKLQTVLAKAAAAGGPAGVTLRLFSSRSICNPSLFPWLLGFCLMAEICLGLCNLSCV